MDKITPLAWVAIIVIVVITVGINLLLVTMLRGRKNMDEVGRRLKARGPGTTARVIQDMQKIAQDPFQKDRQQIEALSNLVARLSDHSSESEDAGHDSSQN